MHTLNLATFWMGLAADITLKAALDSTSLRWPRQSDSRRAKMRPPAPLRRIAGHTPLKWESWGMDHWPLLLFCLAIVNRVGKYNIFDILEGGVGPPTPCVEVMPPSHCVEVVSYVGQCNSIYTSTRVLAQYVTVCILRISTCSTGSLNKLDQNFSPFKENLKVQALWV